ncbi:hypothetical protein [Flavitalea sp.]|nr:hypothetical protein [Flavitalea sp.]
MKKVIGLSLIFFLICGIINAQQRIDRKALVERHTIVNRSADTLSSLSVGNGQFAFTVDITGLQSFPDVYENGVPLGTQSEWGWHSFPNTEGYRFEETLRNYDLNGRSISYSVQTNGPVRNKNAVEWFRQNPHRLQIGNIGFELLKKNGSLAGIEDIRNIEQTLNMWTGEIHSKFTIEDVPVDVITYGHQQQDGVGVKVSSELLNEGRLQIRVRFPYPTGEWKDVGSRLESNSKHRSVIYSRSVNATSLRHEIDNVSWFVNLQWRGKAEVTAKDSNYFLISPYAVASTSSSATSSSATSSSTASSSVTSSSNKLSASQPASTLFQSILFQPPLYSSQTNSIPEDSYNGSQDSYDGPGTFEFSFRFDRQQNNIAQSFSETRDNNRQEWNKFWTSGAAVDFSGSLDKRAIELERRIVLSQYLTKIQCAGNFPPQETGLTYNSWYGRPHMEMHWWHGIHFSLWGRNPLLENSLSWYKKSAAKGRAIAKRQGYQGIRWQKMTDNDGNESPSSVGAFLIWQQPHLIYFAELIYRNDSNKPTIDKYKDLVFATADFMVSYAFYDSIQKRYILGPGLIPAQETFNPLTTFNPAYELVYWHWALKIARAWRIRAGLPPVKKWDDVLKDLSPLTVKENKYLFTENAVDSYTNPAYRTDHPSVLGALGMLPQTSLVDTAIMQSTFNWIWKNWNWDHTWGWDFPMAAMTATRLGLPEQAIEALLMPISTNTYLNNGHNYQDKRLTIYLPGNGGLLAAIAMMCAGYDGCKTDNPGIPKNGKWTVRWEGLGQMP